MSDDSLPGSIGLLDPSSMGSVIEENKEEILIGSFPHYRRLPYPDKSNLCDCDKAFKDKVKGAMKEVGEKFASNQELDNLILSGTYQEGDWKCHRKKGSDKGDIENNLFYNFDGSVCFKKLAKTGIRFEKNPLKSKDGQYHYNYSLMKTESPSEPQYYNSKVIAELKGCVLTEPRDALRVWYDVKSSGKPEPKSRRPIRDKDFGLVVDIFTNEKVEKVNLADLIKHVFDGIITSFHYDKVEDSYYERTKEIISCKLGLLNNEDNARLDEFLKSSDGSESLLGERAKLFWYTKDGRIQTNPADDRCIFGELVVKYDKKERQDARCVINFKVLSLESSQS